MDDPLLETKLDFDEYLKQVSERSVSKDRGANRSKSVDSPESKKEFAVKHRNETLLSSSLYTWKIFTSSMKGRKVIQEEHSQRKDMIQRLVQNLSLSSARDQSFRPDVKKNNSAHGTTSHTNKNIKIKKPEAVTTDIKGGPKRERLITDSTANSLNKRNGGHLLHDRGATESQSGKERQPQLRTTSNGRSGGFDGVISEQKDNNGCKDVDHSVLEYSDSDSDERVRRRDHDNSGRYADHFSSRVRSAENVRSREPDEYEDDFENYSTEEDPEPAMPPPPAYQPQRLHIDDERNSLQAQSKAFAPRSDDDVDAFNFADRSLNGAQAFLRGDQSVPEDSNRDIKYRNGSDKETPTSRQNRGGEKAMSANISGLQQKAAPDKSSRLISGLSGGHGASSSQAPLRSVSARGQSKDVNQPQHPSQARRRGDDSKGSMMGRGNATNSNSTGDRNARVISNSTSSLTSNSAVADQRAILEQRALERRERVLFLQKQAEERVISRLRETEHQIKLKDAKEFESLEKLRYDKRLEVAQNKAKQPSAAAERSQLISMMNKAESFRRSRLLLAALAPWMRLIEQARVDYVKAVSFSHDQLLGRSWGAFLGYTICRRSFNGWRVAQERSQRREVTQMRSVAPRGDRLVLRHVWRLWMLHVQDEQFEREVRNRTAATWHKVQGWLQDTDS